MPEITLHNGSKLASEAVDYARFWEKGAESVPDDTLVIVMKDPSFKSDPVTGQDACDDVKALTAAHVRILWKESKPTPDADP